MNNNGPKDNKKYEKINTDSYNRKGEKVRIIEQLGDGLLSRIKGRIIGSVVSSVNRPIRVSADEVNANIPIRVEASEARFLQVYSYLWVLDYTRGKLVAVQVRDHEIRNIDRNDVFEILSGEPFDVISMIENDVIEFSKYPQLYFGSPVGTFSVSRGSDYNYQREGGVRFAPADSSPVFQPDKDELLEIIGTPTEGIFLGAYSLGSQIFTHGENLVPVYLNEKLLRRHISVNGKTGTGKTEFLKGLITQLIRGFKYGVFATDTQGYIATQITNSINMESKQWYEISENNEAAIWKLAGWDNTIIERDDELGTIGAPIDREKIRILIPTGEDIDSDMFNNAKVTEFGIESIDISNGELLGIYMPTLTVNARAALPGLFNVYVRGNNAFNLQLFRNWLSQLGNLARSGSSTSRLGSIRVSVESDEITVSIGTHTASIHQRSVGSLVRGLDALRNLNVFDIGGKTLNYEDIIEEGYLSVLYLPRDMNPSKKRIYQHQLFNIILRNREKSQKRAIVIDEAQDVIPSAKDGSEFGRAVGNLFREISTQGRKYNISLIVGSQEPAQIHPVVFSQCNTRLFFCLAYKDVDAVRTYLPREFVSQMTQYKVGYGLMISPDNMLVSGVELKTPRAPVEHRDMSRGE